MSLNNQNTKPAYFRQMFLPVDCSRYPLGLPPQYRDGAAIKGRRAVVTRKAHNLEIEGAIPSAPTVMNGGSPRDIRRVHAMTMSPQGNGMDDAAVFFYSLIQGSNHADTQGCCDGFGRAVVTQWDSLIGGNHTAELTGPAPFTTKGADYERRRFSRVRNLATQKCQDGICLHVTACRSGSRETSPAAWRHLGEQDGIGNTGIIPMPGRTGEEAFSLYVVTIRTAAKASASSSHFGNALHLSP